MHDTVQALIAHYRLEPLPIEGTLFASTYRSAQNTLDGGPVGTAIIGLYCHEPRSCSSFHRLPHDEIWHFYDGDPLRLVLLHPDGSSQDVILGPDFAAGQHLQYVVPAQTWQAGELETSHGLYALFGCTMAPGFTSANFEGALSTTLLAQYPDRAADILRLCPTQGETRMDADFAH